jgi:glycosyltransferase involved in cell wall biosynthesis
VPLISIGMPVFNGAESIAASIDSLLAQTVGDFELIICDNASTDATADVCARTPHGTRASGTTAIRRTSASIRTTT